VISQGAELKTNILNHYYSKVYKNYLFASKGQSRGIAYFENYIEKCWRKKISVERVLEIGAGQGEHWPHLSNIPTKEYVALDLRERTDPNYFDQMSVDFQEKLRFVIADAQKIPIEDNYFDRVFSTCVLHHVDDPLSVLIEARRVTKIEGEILFAMPTDPGLANQLVKKLISYRELSKHTKYDPKLFYALEHQNHIRGLMTLIEFVFQSDDFIFNYSPFSVKSWNMNLIVTASIIKKAKSPLYLLEEVDI
jgi:ubiquinone/menaquinone biosynthesis C-methylase UbiE